MYDPYYPRRVLYGWLGRALGLGFCSIVLLAVAALFNAQSHFLATSRVSGTSIAVPGAAQPDSAVADPVDPPNTNSPSLIPLYPDFAPEMSELPPLVPVPGTWKDVPPVLSAPVQGSAPSAPNPFNTIITSNPPPPSAPTGSVKPPAPEPKGGNENQNSNGGGAHGNDNGSGKGKGKGHN